MWKPVDLFLLHKEGVARSFFSQQLISASAKGGCDGPKCLGGFDKQPRACKRDREKRMGEKKIQGEEECEHERFPSADFIFMGGKPQKTNKQKALHKSFMDYPLKLQKELCRKKHVLHNTNMQ